jgi:hypothetical protein
MELCWPIGKGINEALLLVARLRGLSDTYVFGVVFF